MKRQNNTCPAWYFCAILYVLIVCPPNIGPMKASALAGQLKITIREEPDPVLDFRLKIREKPTLALMEAERARDPRERARLYDEIIRQIEKRPVNPERVGHLARAYLGKANAADSLDQKMLMYDEIVSRFGHSDDGGAIKAVAEVYLAKAAMAAGAEKHRLLDMVISRYQHVAEFEAILATEEAYKLKIGLLPNRHDQIEMANRRMAWLEAPSEGKSSAISPFRRGFVEGVRRSKLVNAMRDLATLMDVPGEKIAIYKDIMSRFGDSVDGNLSFEITQTLFDWADVTEDIAEKIHLYDMIVKWCEPGGLFARDYAERAIAAKEKLVGSRGFVSDGRQKETRKASLTGDDYRMAYEALQTARQAKTLRELIAGLDHVISRYQGSGNDMALSIVASAMQYKAAMNMNVSERVALYDGIIQTFSDNANRSVLRNVVEALCKKAAMTTDLPTAISLCDQALGIVDSEGEKVSPSTPLEQKIALYGKSPEAAAVCDALAELYSHDTSGNLYAAALMEKTQVVATDAERRELFQKIISLAQTSSKRTESHYYIEAIFGMVDLATDKNDKIVLCDRLLGEFPRVMELLHDSKYLSVLKKKAEITGDNSEISAYYEEKISRENDPEKRRRLEISRAEDIGDKEELFRLREKDAKGAKQDRERMILQRDLQVILSELRLVEEEAEKEAVVRKAITRMDEFKRMGAEWLCLFTLKDMYAEVSDREMRITICDEVISRGVSHAEKGGNFGRYLHFAGLALLKKMALLRDADRTGPNLW